MKHLGRISLRSGGAGRQQVALLLPLLLFLLVPAAFAAPRPEGVTDFLAAEPVPPYIFPETGKSAFDVAKEIARQQMSAEKE